MDGIFYSPKPVYPKNLTQTERDNVRLLVDYVYSFLSHSKDQRPPVTPEALEYWFTEDFVYYDPTWKTPVYGREGFKEVLDKVRGSFVYFRINLYRVFPLIDYVTTDWIYWTRLRQPYPGFKKVDEELTAVGTTRIRIRDGKMCEMWQIFNCVEDVPEVAVQPEERTALNISRFEDLLTRRELEITRWICEGKTNEEIALILEISRRTVEKHCESIYKKLRVENRKAAMVLGFIADVESGSKALPGQDG